MTVTLERTEAWQVLGTLSKEGHIRLSCCSPSRDQVFYNRHVAPALATQKAY